MHNQSDYERSLEALHVNNDDALPILYHIFWMIRENIGSTIIPCSHNSNINNHLVGDI